MSRMRTRFRPKTICWVLLAVILPATAPAAEYTVTGDWRQIEDFFLPLPPGSQEGAIGVTVTADRPIELVESDPAFVREDAFTFSTVFPWNWTQPRTPGFYDDLGDTTFILVTPSPPRDYTPGAHGIPVVSITTELAGLWDPETGIYVVGNYTNFDQRGGAWEREARFQYFEPGNGLVVDEPWACAFTADSAVFTIRKACGSTSTISGPPIRSNTPFFRPDRPPSAA